MVQIILTILLSSVKYAMTFPLAVMQFEFSFLETILWTNMGGIMGIYFFAFLSDRLISWWNRTYKKFLRSSQKERSPEKRIFTKRNRRIVRIKKQYGLFGIAISTPFLLSIPVGVFLRWLIILEMSTLYRSDPSRILALAQHFHHSKAI